MRQFGQSGLGQYYSAHSNTRAQRQSCFLESRPRHKTTISENRPEAMLQETNTHTTTNTDPKKNGTRAGPPDPPHDPSILIRPEMYPKNWSFNMNISNACENIMQCTRIWNLEFTAFYSIKMCLSVGTSFKKKNNA